MNKKDIGFIFGYLLVTGIVLCFLYLLNLDADKECQKKYSESYHAQIGRVWFCVASNGDLKAY